MRSLSLFIALRYLKGLRRGQAAPLLAGISIAALAVGTGALIVLFSVFNGFNGVITDLYKAFYPDIRITAAKGKFFTPDERLFQTVKSQPNVAAMARVLEDNVWVTNAGDQQVVATVKGVDNTWFSVNNLAPYIGEESMADFTRPDAPEIIVGNQLAAQLGVQPGNPFARVALHYPNAKAAFTISNAADAFQTEIMQPTGVFAVQQDFDGRYMLAPIRKMQSLLLEPNAVSAIELKLRNAGDDVQTSKALQAALGAGYKVETRYEQNRTLYAVLRSEKWAIYAILLFVLLLASVNMVGALSLLALEKEKDAAILKAMGARPGTIRKAFLLEGVLWGALGGGIGLLLGGLICAGQQAYSWVKLEGFIVEAYPVAMQLSDFVVVMLTAMLVGLLAAAYPAVRLAKKQLAGAWNYR